MSRTFCQAAWMDILVSKITGGMKVSALVCLFLSAWLREEFWLEQVSCQDTGHFSAMNVVTLNMILKCYALIFGSVC